MKNKSDFGSIADLTANNFHPEQIFQFWLFKKNVGSTYADDKKGVMVKRVYPISKTIKLQTNISYNNEKTGRLEQAEIRHCIGETEIIKALQTPDDRVTKIISTLTFVDGHKMIQGTDVTLLKFMALDDRNASKPNRNTSVTPLYYLYDGNQVVEQAMKVEDDLFELQTLIRDPKNLDMLTAYARVILPQPEFDKIYGNFNLIKHRMLGLSKGNPTLFKQGLNNPATLRKHYILEAIDAGVLNLNTATNCLYLKNGELVQQSTMGLSPINLFVDKITEDRTGGTSEMYKHILNLLNQDGDKIIVDEKVKAIHNSNSNPAEEAALTLQLEYLYKEGKNVGLIVKSGNGYIYRDKRGVGVDGFMQLLKSDPQLVEILKIELEKLAIAK